MKKIKHYVLPENANGLYEKEASSSIGLARGVADKVNEIVDGFNELLSSCLEWQQTQEGTIRKGVVFMKDNLVNSLHDLLTLYEADVMKTSILEVFGDTLDQLKTVVTPQMFGAVADGVTNDIVAIENAIASLKEGDVLYFPKGTYVMSGHAVTIDTPHITFAGEGLILCDYGFRPKASHFKAVGLHMKSLRYASECRAFMIESSILNYIEDFSFKNCFFENFFYSVCAVGGSYNYDGTEEAVGYPVRDLVIENCHSSTYEDKNAGHFQCIQVENISYINNRTYGGQNASSYNAIKGNGFIRVIGNYDHNNSYASCEIENGSGNAVVANNTFNSKIWIDDSFDAVVNGNSVEDGILITVGSNNGDANNIVVSNNVCGNIRCERFGTYYGGIINNINITGNNVKGDNTHGIWLHGNAVKNAKVCNNLITGTNTNDIAIQRNAQLDCYVHNNFGNRKLLLIAGSEGKVYAVDNYGFTSSGTRDALPASHLEREFNGLRVTDATNVAWRLGVNTSGEVFATKY